MNRVILVGRMAADPEVGDKVTRFRVAVDNYDTATQSRSGMFIPCKAFSRAKETADRFLGKGDRVALEGRLDIRDNGQSGPDKRIYTDVIVDRIDLLETKKTSSKPANETESSSGW